MQSKNPLKPLFSSKTLFLFSCLFLNLGLVFGQASYEKLKDFGNSDVMGSDPADVLLLASDGALYGVTSGGGKRQLGTLFKANKDGTGYQVLHHFGIGDDGQAPRGGLLEAVDGFLYGTTSSGASFGMGVIYRVQKDGSDYQILHRFDGYPGGSYATGCLIQGSDGALYGTTAHGGNDTNASSGLVYRLDPAGTNFVVLRYFSGSDGRVPSGALVEGSDGALYGTTYYGGTFDDGVVFRISRDGNSFSVLRVFSWSDNQGEFPNELIEASDGMLYGTTGYGGAGGGIFKLSKTGAGFSSYAFPGSGLSNPLTRLVQGTDGFLYGTTHGGGSYHQGAIFRIAKDWTGFSVLHEFGSVTNDGQSAAFPLAKGDAGTFYGLAGGGQSGAGIIFKVDPSTFAYQIIRQFSSSGGDAANPSANLIESVDGRIYGIAEKGGSAGAGAVFRLHSNGTGYEFVHEFIDSSIDGARPKALLAGVDGALYGVASAGGSSNSGTVFRVTTNGDVMVLHSFAGPPTDGMGPNGLIQASDGDLYGTTDSGGTSNLGTIFKVTSAGSNYLVLRNLGGSPSDGAQPLSGVIEGADGVLYGATQRGVTNDIQKIFRINKDGTDYRLLLELPLPPAEILASPRLLEGSDSWLYGTHSNGDAPYSGLIYKLRKDSTGFAVLHRFAADGSEGWWPKAGIIEGENGLLYGTTSDKGAGGGTVFRIAKDGSGFAVIYSFGSVTNDGAGPSGALLQSKDGRLYGTTTDGGEMSLGSVFRLTTTELTKMKLSWSNGLPVLLWNAVNGVQYSVQWKSNLSSNIWQNLPGDVLATGPDASKSDNPSASGQRFYRVICPR
jgi:uncharacterized repeat protein (TIGR03803 family)